MRPWKVCVHGRQLIPSLIAPCRFLHAQETALTEAGAATSAACDGAGESGTPAGGGGEASEQYKDLSVEDDEADE